MDPTMYDGAKGSGSYTQEMHVAISSARELQEVFLTHRKCLEPYQV